MSLRIRLTRVGAKKQASYRIVVADSHTPRDGKAIAVLGHYNPLTDPFTLKVDPEKAVAWLKTGAQPSETARGLLTKAGVMTAYEDAKKRAAAQLPAKAVREKHAPRPARTAPPRLVRPPRAEVVAAAAEPAEAVAEAAPAPARRGRAAAKPKEPAADKPKAPRARTSRAAAKVAEE